jgi:hypothetical protein
MKLTKEQDAIKQAVEAGYAPKTMNRLDFAYLIARPDENEKFFPLILQDPAFWQALGKARGWKSGCNICTEVHFTGMHNASDEEAYECKNPKQHMTTGYQDPWLHHALRYFETRLSNGDPEAFWQSLP